MAIVNRDPIIGFTIRKSGNRSAQTATITIDNEDGDYWTNEFPARAPVSIIVDGEEEFNGFVDNLAVSAGVPGQVVVECAGRTMRLRDADVRPLLYDDDADSDERDGAGVPAQVSGGQIQLPLDARHVPIDDLISVKVGANYVLALNMDKENGIIYVDQKYNGSQAIVSYTCFKSSYENESAYAVVSDLMDRYGEGYTYAGLENIATLIGFEPSRKGNLLTEIGRIRDYLGNTFDFYLDNSDDLHFFQRDETPVAILAASDVQRAEFSVDYSGYANKVVVRSNEAVTNTLDPTGSASGAAAFINVIEGLNPTGSQVDVVAQGFKALDSRLMDFSVRAARATEEDAIDWSVQYNGRKEAIYDDLTASHSLTPDSTNINIEPASDRLRVKANGVGTAYYSSDWREDLNQDTDGTSTSITTTSNIYQTVTVADLTRKKVKGIAFKTASTSNAVTFKVYSGADGNTGTLLGTSEPVTLAGTTDREHETNWFQVYFVDEVDVSAETTISIVPNTDAGTFLWSRSSTSAYAGGTAKNGATDLTSDFTFQFFTVQVLQDILAGSCLFKDSVATANRTPQYFLSRNYTVGNPDAATWTQVFNNTPVLFTDNQPGARLGFKVVFNSGSITTDPYFYYAKASCAYAAADVALDQPSGIIVGSLYGRAESDALPYYNPTTGTFTNPISTDDTRLEPNGNYWLALVDGNQVSSASHFTAFYNDGSSASYTEDWANTNAVSSSTDLLVENGQAAIVRNKKWASFFSTDVITTANQVTAALFLGTNNERGARVFPLVSRNRRNYYNPERSTDTAKPAANTGEMVILQFDAADVVTGPGTTLKKVIDQSGNGFDALVHHQSYTASGKYGGGIVLNKTHPGRQGISSIAQWMMGDWSIAFWLQPTAALVADRRILTMTDGTRWPIIIAITAAGQLRVQHTYSDGVSTETFDTDNTNSATVLANGVWTHVALRRTGLSTYDVYFDGVLKNTYTIVNQPDFCLTHSVRGAVASVPELVLVPGTGDPTYITGTLDELRVWPRVVEDWVINHVKDYAYRDPNVKFTFPAEADGTDDYTTADAADANKRLVRVAEFLWPTFNYEDGILARSSFQFSNYVGTAFNSTTNDLSSYAHVTTSNALVPANDIVTGGAYGTRLDLDGSTEWFAFTNDDYLHLASAGSLLWHQTQDVTGTKQTIFHKRGEIKVETTATSASLTDLKVTLTCFGGVTREATFTGLSAGTSQTHFALTYDGTVLQVFVAGTLAGSADFASPLGIAKGTANFYVGAENPSGATVANHFDGKIDELIMLNYVASAADIAALDNDVSVGLRGPIQSSYVVSAYDGTSASIYADGKMLVSRTNGETWVDTLDGSNSNPKGTLAFRMTFGKENVQVIRKSEAEIERAGITVSKVFEVPSTRLESMVTAAEGYLDMLSDGIAKGSVTIDGRTGFEVGEIVTIDYPEKGQNFVNYAVAAVDLVQSEGVLTSTLQLGEEERSIEGLFGAVEVGIQ